MGHDDDGVLSASGKCVGAGQGRDDSRHGFFGEEFHALVLDNLYEAKDAHVSGGLMM